MRPSLFSSKAQRINCLASCSAVWDTTCNTQKPPGVSSGWNMWQCNKLQIFLYSIVCVRFWGHLEIALPASIQGKLISRPGHVTIRWHINLGWSFHCQLTTSNQRKPLRFGRISYSMSEPLKSRKMLCFNPPPKCSIALLTTRTTNKRKSNRSATRSQAQSVVKRIDPPLATSFHSLCSR